VLAINNEGARRLPAYWGKWFISISDSTMRATDLNVFYHLGSQLNRLAENSKTGQPIVELFVYSHSSRQWLSAFLKETEELADPLKGSRAVVTRAIAAIDAVTTPQRIALGTPVTADECGSLIWAEQHFEEVFEHECKNLQVFTVTPKGTHDTILLVEKPEYDLPKVSLSKLPDQFLYDLKQSARCLAFDIPTACAFHACRATESLMLAYHEALTKKPWPYPKNRDWSAYINHLTKEGAPPTITGRLGEIRDNDRNAYIHPDKNVPLEEARVLYGLCSGVNYYMAEEINRLNP
jgi:hypothetical protein